jgi:hypothetical protein
LADLVSTTTYLVDPGYEGYFQDYLAARREILGENVPAGALIGVSQLANPRALVDHENAVHTRGARPFRNDGARRWGCTSTDRI